MVFRWFIIFGQVASNAAEYQTRRNAFRLSGGNVDLPESNGLLRH